MKIKNTEFRRWEFLFCFVIIWAAALLQGYGLYREWREEQVGTPEIERCNTFLIPPKCNEADESLFFE